MPELFIEQSISESLECFNAGILWTMEFEECKQQSNFECEQAINAGVGDEKRTNMNVCNKKTSEERQTFCYGEGKRNKFEEDSERIDEDEGKQRFPILICMNTEELTPFRSKRNIFAINRAISGMRMHRKCKVRPYHCSQAINPSD